jgi:hypothetical protein
MEIEPGLGGAQNEQPGQQAQQSSENLGINTLSRGNLTGGRMMSGVQAVNTVNELIPWGMQNCFVVHGMMHPIQQPARAGSGFVGQNRVQTTNLEHPALGRTPISNYMNNSFMSNGNSLGSSSPNSSNIVQPGTHVQVRIIN